MLRAACSGTPRLPAHSSEAAWRRMSIATLHAFPFPAQRCVPSTKPCRDRHPAPHLHLLQHRVVFYPREQNPHGISAVIQERDAGPIQVVSQFVNVRLQLSKGWMEKKQNSVTRPPAHRTATQNVPWHPTDGSQGNAQSWIHILHAGLHIIAAPILHMEKQKRSCRQRG